MAKGGVVQRALRFGDIDRYTAQQRNDDESWYRGTADAVYQNHDILEGYGADYIVVGRPIRDAADPRAAAERIQAEIAAVFP